MEKKTIKGRCQKIMALIIAGLMFVSAMPLSMFEIQAATTEHQDCVTIEVNDENGDAVEGATVEYSITDISGGGNGVATTSLQTDVNGVVEVLANENFVADSLEITASVSKEGFVTDDTTIKERSISSDNENIVVELQASALPAIENPVISLLNADYSEGVEQELVTSVTTDTEGVTIEYSVDNANWSENCPKREHVGEYTVYVKISKDGFEPYISGALTAKINAININDIDIEAKTLIYQEGNEQELVTLTGAFNDGDTVTWYVNDEVTGSRDIPKKLAAGTYNVKLEVNRGSDYNLFTKEVTTQIANAQLDLTGLEVRALSGVYNGNPQDTVTVNNKGDYELKYQLDEGNKSIDEDAWQETVPVVTNAGQYIVWVKAVKVNYDDKNVDVIPAEGLTAPYNVYVAKADQTFKFDDNNYNSEESTIELSKTQLTNRYEIDFSATDENAFAGGSITYSVELAPRDTGIASIDDTGKLVVCGAGEVVVKAVLSGNDNYNSCEISHKLNVVAKKTTEGEYVSFENSTIEYEVGDLSGIPSNVATKSHSFDSGTITYSIDRATEYGLAISDSGTVSICDYKKLLNSVENSNGNLTVTVKAVKGEVKPALITYYPKDTATYSLVLKLQEAPSNPYKMYLVDDTTEVTSANGSDGWYNSTIEVVPTDGYKIVRTDSVGTDSVEFYTSVKFGETVDGTALDQGSESNRTVYLQEISTGKITRMVTTSIDKMDTVKPYNLKMTYPSTTEIDNVNYYGKKVAVTFTAYDSTSGVKEFHWEYNKKSGSSSGILEADSGTVAASLDTTDASGKKYTGSLTLPKDAVSQLKGNLKIYAVDTAGNISTAFEDPGVFVIDTIAPQKTISYQLKNGVGTTQAVDNKQYFSNDVEYTFKIVEQNFFSSDVEVSVSKDGGAAVRQSLSWNATGNLDEYEAKLVLSEDGDYVVKTKYKDRSGNQMAEYTSDIIVVDKTKPAMNFQYFDNKETSNPQTAEVVITEHNFRASDISVEVISKDLNGNTIIANNLERYLRECSWEHDGDVHKAIISNEFVDAIYDLTINYKDLALNAADTRNTGPFVVDRTAPRTSEMDVSYSSSIKDVVLSAITFGFYNPTVTVTFTAYDKVSGIDYFEWRYQRQESASDINIEKYEDNRVFAVQDSEDRSKYTASITLPRNEAEQLRGCMAFSATDRYGNVSEMISDDKHVIVVDTISPSLNVEYTVSDNVLGEKNYYNKSIVATFTLNEANFYAEDVKVYLQKNGEIPERINLAWENVIDDVYVGTYTIVASPDHVNDGDYIFSVEYTDRSNNQMTPYTSGVMVLDTTSPVVSVEYANKTPISVMEDGEGNARAYYATANTATVTITEHNFNPNDVQYTIIAKDVAGNVLDANALHTKSEWSSLGDNHTITISYSGDANYTFDIAYTDLAKLDVADYNPDYFTVDTTKPANLQISYSTSLLDTILSGISFGFYNAKATVTITATDNISGVNMFKYDYINAVGVSAVNAQMVNDLIDASRIVVSNNGATGTASFEIPRDVLVANNQFNGNLDFTAYDRANNEADYLRDTKRIVVDNITPTINIEYNAPVQTVDGISYYDGDINATVTITEANFYPEDVKINVTRDGSASAVNASWRSVGTDTHIGTFTLTGDGEYLVTINYTDKSNNRMQEYTSEQMTIDTEIEEATISINGEDANGKAFKEDVVIDVNFEDTNFESYEMTLLRTSYAEKNVDVTEQFIGSRISTNETGGNGSIDTIDMIAENDGIYTLTVELQDKAGHTVESSATFTVNRYGSVYEYNDYLASLVADGGAYVQAVSDDFVITEYNADRLVKDSLNIEISRDGKPIDDSIYQVSPEINEFVETGDSGWFQYSYTISKENFAGDGVYKISVSSQDATGNNPENSNYEDKDILFRVDSTAPEITSITGLESDVVNATEDEVKYSVYDTIGLKSVSVYVDGKELETITEFNEDINNFTGSFTLGESSVAQAVRLVVTDLAGNITDTDSPEFVSAYAFSNMVTVSTNMFVRWFANKAIFFGTVGGGAAVVGGGVGATMFIRKKKFVKTKK